MASKKYTLLTLLLSLGLSGAFAQLAGSVDYMDSTKYGPKKMAQYNEWANGLASSPFPPKPRDAWQMSVFGGYAGLFGDVNTSPGWNVGVSARKAIGYVVSIRPSISYRKITGLGYENHYNLVNLPTSVRDKYAAAGLNTYVHNFQTEMLVPALDVLLSLNNIMFHRKQSNYNYYLLAGYSAVIYETNVEALDDQGNPYNYSGVDFLGKRKDIKDQLESYYDSKGGQNYETGGYIRPRRNNLNDSESDRSLRHAFNLGAGLERRLGDIATLSAEFKFTGMADDWVDGYAVGLANAYTSSNDLMFSTNIGININLGLKSRKKFLQQVGKDENKTDLGQFPGKRVAPLWNNNPLAQPYGELGQLRNPDFASKFLQDSDTDGVLDNFDLEPNTPAGAPVDTRGRTRDTDGDGVPDYLDKELITPTACQPVNADGIGKCPDPECCSNRPVDSAAACNIGSLPSVQFASGKSGLSSSSTAILDAAAEQIKANPNCKICVVGYGGSSKREQQLSWDRVNSVINYLYENKGISRDRFVFKYGESGDANTVDLQDCTGEEGPNNVPPPHPQYRTNK